MSFSGILSGIALSIMGLFSLVVVGNGAPGIVFIPTALVLLGTGLYMIFNTHKEDIIDEIRKK